MTACPQISMSVPLVLTTVMPTLYVPILLGASIVRAGLVTLEMESLVLVRLHNCVVSPIPKLMYSIIINSSVA